MINGKSYTILDDIERYQPTDTMILTASKEKEKMLTPITISEDDDDGEINDIIDSLCDIYVSVAKANKSHNDIHDIHESVNERDASIRSTMRRPRCYSLPSRFKPKSIMKIRTIDESLHSTYGSEDEMITGSSRKHDSLTFDKICIREYSRTVGDNPSCSSGPPVSLSWDYNILGDIDLDFYEQERPPRRVQNEMILPRNMREDLLKFECNISRKEITDSVRQNLRVKNQRRTTLNNLGKATKFEEAMESASRKLKRFVNREKPIHKQVKDMEEQIDLSNRRRSKLTYLEQNMSQEGEDTSDKVSLLLSGSADGSESS